MYEINDRALIEAARRVELARPSVQRRIVLEREMRLHAAPRGRTPLPAAMHRLSERILVFVRRDPPVDKTAQVQARG